MAGRLLSKGTSPEPRAGIHRASDEFDRAQRDVLFASAPEEFPEMARRRAGRFSICGQGIEIPDTSEGVEGGPATACKFLCLRFAAARKKARTHPLADTRMATI